MNNLIKRLYTVAPWLILAVLVGATISFCASCTAPRAAASGYEPIGPYQVIGDASMIPIHRPETSEWYNVYDESTQETEQHPEKTEPSCLHDDASWSVLLTYPPMYQCGKCNQIFSEKEMSALLTKQEQEACQHFFIRESYTRDASFMADNSHHACICIHCKKLEICVR